MAEENQRIELEVMRMTCDDCAQHVRRALQQVVGVQEASVPHWAAGCATVLAVPTVSDGALTEAVRQAGYRARVLSRRTVQPAVPPLARAARRDYDLLVIGTGGGGMGAAIRGAELG